MIPRIDYMKASPGGFKAVLGLEHYVAETAGLDPTLLHLLKIRASQVNGCAYCVDMHVKEARAAGLGEQWIALIAAWRESPVYTERERAVLAWTEAVTQVSRSGAPDEDFAPLGGFFSDAEIVDLTLAISTINVWNRLAVAMRIPHELDEERHAA